LGQISASRLIFSPQEVQNTSSLTRHLLFGTPHLGHNSASFLIAAPQLGQKISSACFSAIFISLQK
jgi:hypothetical protein